MAGSASGWLTSDEWSPAVDQFHDSETILISVVDCLTLMRLRLLLSVFVLNDCQCQVCLSVISFIFTLYGVTINHIRLHWASTGEEMTSYFASMTN